MSLFWLLNHLLSVLAALMAIKRGECFAVLLEQSGVRQLSIEEYDTLIDRHQRRGGLYEEVERLATEFADDLIEHGISRSQRRRRPSAN